MWKVKVGSEILIFVSNNKYTCSGKKRVARIFSAMLLLGVPFLRRQFGFLQLFSFLLLIAPTIGGANHFGVQLPLVGAITDENTSARAAHCDKTKGGWGGQFGSSNHNSYFKHKEAMKRQNSGTGY